VKKVVWRHGRDDGIYFPNDNLHNWNCWKLHGSIVLLHEKDDKNFTQRVYHSLGRSRNDFVRVLHNIWFDGIVSRFWLERNDLPRRLVFSTLDSNFAAGDDRNNFEFDCIFQEMSVRASWMTILATITVVVIATLPYPEHTSEEDRMEPKKFKTFFATSYYLLSSSQFISIEQLRCLMSFSGIENYKLFILIISSIQWFAFISAAIICIFKYKTFVTSTQPLVRKLHFLVVISIVFCVPQSLIGVLETQNRIEKSSLTLRTCLNIMTTLSLMFKPIFYFCFDDDFNKKFKRILTCFSTPQSLETHELNNVERVCWKCQSNVEIE
jgi:hypothetical protein